MTSTTASVAHAESAYAAENKAALDKDTPPLHRDGWTPAFGLRTGFAHVRGYPNDARAIDNADFYSSSDLLIGTSFSFHLGYALTDYLSFGFMTDFDHFESAHWREHGLGVGIRVDAYPLVRFYPRLADLGIFLEVGIGSATMEAKVGNYPNADGTQSYSSTGAFYELTILRGKSSHLALAPEAKYEHIDSASINSDSFTMGLRLAYFTGK